MGRNRIKRAERKGKSKKNKSFQNSEFDGKGARKDRHQIIIFCEGPTEQEYFKQLKEYEDLCNIYIEPDIKAGSDWEKIFNRLNNSYIDDVSCSFYCVLDLDQQINQDKMPEYLTKKGKLPIPIENVIETYMCFETWILMHYKDNPKSGTYCRTSVDELKKIEGFGNYIKGDKFNSIYSILKDNQKKACTNAERLELKRNKDIKKGIYKEKECRLVYSSMWRLIKELLK